MKVTVRRWGNSFGIHLPKNLDGVGPLHDGMELDAALTATKDFSNWKPYLVKTGDPNLSQKVDQILEEAFEEKWGPRRVNRSS